jgi:hypothetical protein
LSKPPAKIHYQHPKATAIAIAPFKETQKARVSKDHEKERKKKKSLCTGEVREGKVYKTNGKIFTMKKKEKKNDNEKGEKDGTGLASCAAVHI